jgi:hypothetical protein
VVGVHIGNHLTADVPIGGGLDTVHLPSADLEWTGSPRFEVGYRLDQGCGDILFGYRSLVTEGSTNIPGFDVGDGFLKSRLNMNVADLDYASREFFVLPRTGLKWFAGVRLGSVYFDSRATGQVLEQRTSNSFLGAGPRGGLELSWRPATYPLCRLFFFGRLEGAVLVGQVKQSFEETVTGPDGEIIGGALTQRSTQAVPILHFQTGVGYTPPWGDQQLHFRLGYDFEQWWSVGGSKADLTLNGIFFRTEFSF